MSSQVRPRDTLMTVCDLCDEPITSEHHARNASLVHGYGSFDGAAGKPKAKAWYLRWNPREWAGGRAPTWLEIQNDKPKWGERHYDFHTECILKLVETAIAHRENEERKQADQ